jgi:hypothetical protein
MGNDARWERLRVLVGIGLIDFFGLALWRNSVRPLVEKGLGGGDMVREVRLGVYRWALERKRAQFQKEEADKKKALEQESLGEQQKRGGEAVKGGTAGTVHTGSQ